MSKEKVSLRVVCFGGGSALPRVVLAGLKNYPVKITSVTSMVESGGSTGQLRQDLNVLPAGDISRHLIALSDAPQWKRSLFYSRFGNDKFSEGHIGHRFGTFFISVSEYLSKDFEKTLNFVRDFLEVKRHQSLPATLGKTDLLAVLMNGQIIKGEGEIDVPKKHNPKLRIKKVFLKPKVRAYPPVLTAIRKADLIVIGPGDIYSSLIPCFLPDGIKKAVQKSRSIKVLVCNIMTKRGESDNFTVMDFVREIEKYIGCSFDFVLYNNKIPDKNRIREYKKEKPLFVDLVRIDSSIKSGRDNGRFIGDNLLTRKGPLLHDPNKVARILLKLCRQ